MKKSPETWVFLESAFVIGVVANEQAKVFRANIIGSHPVWRVIFHPSYAMCFCGCEWNIPVGE
jgi:hypothetical protein